MARDSFGNFQEAVWNAIRSVVRVGVVGRANADGSTTITVDGRSHYIYVRTGATASGGEILEAFNKGIPRLAGAPCLLIKWNRVWTVIGVDADSPAVTENVFSVAFHQHKRDNGLSQSVHDLDGMPSSIAGRGGALLRVNDDEDGYYLADATTGTGLVDSVNGETGAVVIDADDIDDAATTNKFATAAELTKLAGIETGANLYVHPNHTGDVTSVADGATTIANDAVTNAKAADMAADTLKGRANGAGTGDPTDLTATQARTILNVADGADVTGAAINAAAADTPLDADKWAFWDVVDAALKSVTWANLKATLVATFLTFTNKIAIAATATSGAALRVARDLASASTDSPVVDIVQDHAGDDQAALRVQQDGTGDIAAFFDGVTKVLGIADGGTSTFQGNVLVESANGRIWGIANLAAGHTVNFQYGGDSFNQISLTHGAGAILDAFHGLTVKNYQGGVGASGPALTVQGHTSVDLQQWKDSAGNLRGKMAADGAFTADGITYYKETVEIAASTTGTLDINVGADSVFLLDLKGGSYGNVLSGNSIVEAHAYGYSGVDASYSNATVTRDGNNPAGAQTLVWLSNGVYRLSVPNTGTGTKYLIVHIKKSTY